MAAGVVVSELAVCPSAPDAVAQHIAVDRITSHEPGERLVAMGYLRR
jgi:hypothetical protein